MELPISVWLLEYATPPFISLLKQEKTLTTYYFNDERCAAFFALGRSRQSMRPVAVVVTSGTAVAHLLPATMESYYTSVPLVLITTDRPRRFRGTNAPQSCEQVGYLGLMPLVNWIWKRAMPWI